MLHYDLCTGISQRAHSCNEQFRSSSLLDGITNVRLQRDKVAFSRLFSSTWQFDQYRARARARCRATRENRLAPCLRSVISADPRFISSNFMLPISRSAARFHRAKADDLYAASDRSPTDLIRVCGSSLALFPIPSADFSRDS